MYYTLHARLKKTEPDYKSDLNLFQTDPVQHDSDQANSGQTNPASPVSTLNNPICIENVLTGRSKKSLCVFHPTPVWKIPSFEAVRQRSIPAISPEVCVSLTGNGCWKHHFVLRFISMNPALYLYRKIPCLTVSLKQ